MQIVTSEKIHKHADSSCGDIVMLHDSYLPCGIVHKIVFSGPAGFFRLLDADAQHLLLHLRFSDPENAVFVNTQRDGVWGEPIRIALGGPGERHSVYFKMTKRAEIWTAAQSLGFERFTKEDQEMVRYAAYRNAHNADETLRLTLERPEEMAAQIATRVALRRIGVLERKLGMDTAVAAPLESN